MPHLVEPILSPTPVTDVLNAVVEANDCLVSAARQTIARLMSVEAVGWGVASKRVKVELPETRPRLVRHADRTHAFAEVVNQCATLERLIGALRWANRELPDFEVEVCHPTTSSQKQSTGRDNDLILKHANSGIRYFFEVSDVASSKGDGNQKEIKDLVSLGVLKSTNRPFTCAPTWPPGRLFLTVSEEFAQYLLRPTRHCLKAGKFHYSEVGREDTTRIIEVIAGPGGSP